MTVPVYLFTGFLESGKTQLIKETLMDPGFNGDEKNLLFVCEEGIEEYSEDFQRRTNTTIVNVEDMDSLNYKFLKQCDSLIEPTRVLIEFNGMWDLTNFLDHVDFPYDWLLVQILSTVDASTFEMYLQNMRSLIYAQLLHSETIIFNRCTMDTNKLYLRNNIKAINKGAQLIYELDNGEIVDLGEDEMPFDVNADHIIISDDDYGLWYMDAMEHPEKYDGKTITLKGKVVSNHVDGMDQAFVFGRMAMVCCADDTSLIGLLVHYPQSAMLVPKEWVSITATIHLEFDEEYNGDVPVLYAKEVKGADALEDEFVYFN